MGIRAGGQPSRDIAEERLRDDSMKDDYGESR